MQRAYSWQPIHRRTSLAKPKLSKYVTQWNHSSRNFPKSGSALAGSNNAQSRQRMTMPKAYEASEVAVCSNELATVFDR
jgi:hypothetical protein